MHDVSKPGESPPNLGDRENWGNACSDFKSDNVPADSKQSVPEIHPYYPLAVPPAPAASTIKPWSAADLPPYLPPVSDNGNYSRC